MQLRFLMHFTFLSAMLVEVLKHVNILALEIDVHGVVEVQRGLFVASHGIWPLCTLFLLFRQLAR